MPDDYSADDAIELPGRVVNPSDAPAADTAEQIRHLARAVGASVAGDAGLVHEFAELAAEEEKYLAPDVIADADEVNAASNLTPDERAEAQLVRDAWLNWARGHIRRLRALLLLAEEQVKV